MNNIDYYIIINFHPKMQDVIGDLCDYICISSGYYRNSSRNFCGINVLGAYHSLSIENKLSSYFFSNKIRMDSDGNPIERPNAFDSKDSTDWDIDGLAEDFGITRRQAKKLFYTYTTGYGGGGIKYQDILDILYPNKYKIVQISDTILHESAYLLYDINKVPAEYINIISACYFYTLIYAWCEDSTGTVVGSDVTFVDGGYYMWKRSVLNRDGTVNIDKLRLDFNIPQLREDNVSICVINSSQGDYKQLY